MRQELNASCVRVTPIQRPDCEGKHSPSASSPTFVVFGEDMLSSRILTGTRLWREALSTTNDMPGYKARRSLYPSTMRHIHQVTSIGIEKNRALAHYGSSGDPGYLEPLSVIAAPLGTTNAARPCSDQSSKQLLLGGRIWKDARVRRSRSDSWDGGSGRLNSLTALPPSAYRLGESRLSYL